MAAAATATAAQKKRKGDAASRRGKKNAAASPAAPPPPEVPERSQFVAPAADAHMVFDEMPTSFNDEAYMSTMGVGSNNSHWSQTNEVDEDDHEYEVDEEGEGEGMVHAPKGRACNYTIEEDIFLCNTWLNVSMDATVETDQTRDTYWVRMKEFFDTHNKSGIERTDRSLRSRWSMINKDCQKWAAAMTAVDKINPSGTNDRDRLNIAQNLFRGEEKKTKKGMGATMGGMGATMRGMGATMGGMGGMGATIRGMGATVGGMGTSMGAMGAMCGMGGMGAPTGGMGGLGATMGGMSFASLMGGMGAPPGDMGGRMASSVPHMPSHDAFGDSANTVRVSNDGEDKEEEEETDEETDEEEEKEEEEDGA